MFFERGHTQFPNCGGLGPPPDVFEKIYALRCGLAVFGDIFIRDKHTQISWVFFLSRRILDA